MRLPRSPACNAGPLAMTDWLSRSPFSVIARSRLKRRRTCPACPKHVEGNEVKDGNLLIEGIKIPRGPFTFASAERRGKPTLTGSTLKRLARLRFVHDRKK